MSNLKHVYITAHGSYPAGSWLGETAQIGIRCSYQPVIAAPVKGSIYTPQEGGAITPDFGTLAGANGTLSKTWTARIGDTGSLENVDAAAQVDLGQDMWTFLGAIKPYQYNAFQWTHVKIAAVDALGKTPVPASVYTFGSPQVGQATTGLPPQVAMALSTRANLVGRRGRGRVYIPAIGANHLNADGTITTAAGTAMRTAFKTLIDNIQAAPGLTVNIPIVFVGSSDSATVVRPVEVRTGSRVDTIQSRRRQVVEVYSSVAL